MYYQTSASIPTTGDDNGFLTLHVVTTYCHDPCLLKKGLLRMRITEIPATPAKAPVINIDKGTVVCNVPGNAHLYVDREIIMPIYSKFCAQVYYFLFC